MAIAKISLHCIFNNNFEVDLKVFKGALSCPRQFLETESPLKIMKNAFLFHIKGSLRFLKYIYSDLEDARVRKTSETRPIFWARTFYHVIKKKALDLQVFCGIGKTMKILQ